MSELRLYAIANAEALKAAGGNRGKMMAQAGHAFLHAFWNAQERIDGNGPHRASQYQFSGAAVKIVLVAENEAALRTYFKAMDENQIGIGITLVTDAARTVFPEPTVTFLGIGPITANEAPDWLKELRVLI